MPPSTTTPTRGRRPSLLRRLAWYTLGIGRRRSRSCASTRRRRPPCSSSLAIGSRDHRSASSRRARHRAQALGIALYRYHRLRFPDIASYPGALANAILTAFIDEAVFRGAALRATCSRLGPRAEPRDPRPGARLRARDAARGARPRPLHARRCARDRPHRRLGDGRHRRHRRGVPRPRDHPRRDLPDDRPRRPAAARGTEPEEVERRRRTPEGWRRRSARGRSARDR